MIAPIASDGDRRGMEAQVVQSIDVGLTADCCEWLAGSSDRDGVLAMATYQLDEKLGKRKGEIRLFSFDAEAQGERLEIKQRCAVDVAGVLDLKWGRKSKQKQQGWLGAATSDGSVYLYKTEMEDDKRKLVHVAKADTEVEQSETSFCLSLDWNDRLDSENPAMSKIVASRADGKLGVVDVNTAQCERSWVAHMYSGNVAPAEVWIAAFDCWDTNVVYSGADEGLLKAWDCRTSTASPSPILVDRHHEVSLAVNR